MILEETTNSIASYHFYRNTRGLEDGDTKFRRNYGTDVSIHAVLGPKCS
jgi:hypothetical protein